MKRPVLLDLFCGRGGWTKAAAAAGWHCIGYDIEDHGYPGELRKLELPIPHTQLENENPTLITASPPCAEYAKFHLPWIRQHGPVDERLLRWSVHLVDIMKCPVVVECSANAARHLGNWRRCGPFYLWGDTPAIMPDLTRHFKKNHAGNKEDGTKKRAAKKAEIPYTLASWIIETARKRT